LIFKILVLGLVLVLVYFLFFKKSRKEEEVDQVTKNSDDVMIECSKCGTYISNKEAIIKDGQFFCSKECAGVK
jgi:uncharacterized protein